MISGSNSSTAFFVGGALRKEIGWGFGGVARLGLANVKSEFAARSSAGTSASASDRSFRALVGFGVEYSVVPHMKVTADLDLTKSAKIDNVGDEYGGTIRALSIGARFVF